MRLFIYARNVWIYKQCRVWLSGRSTSNVFEKFASGFATRNNGNACAAADWWRCDWCVALLASCVKRIKRACICGVGAVRNFIHKSGRDDKKHSSVIASHKNMFDRSKSDVSPKEMYFNATFWTHSKSAIHEFFEDILYKLTYCFCYSRYPFTENGKTKNMEKD